MHCSCDYFDELRAFDEIVIRMTLASVRQNRLSMDFEYWRTSADGETLVARGKQEIACMRREGPRTVPAPVPEELREALAAFSSA